MRAGRLLVVATPIGNLDDMSPRAIEALRSAAVILCEDTRHTRKLLTHFQIDTPAERFDEHTEDAKAASFIERIASGETIAVVSDAGMPLLSDPGYRIVRMAREHGLTVEPRPGPFAAALALVASGIAPQPFTFFGFAPHREGERRDFYRAIAESGHTAIVYESPERILASLEDALPILGDTEVTVAREMTKIHEEFLFGKLSEVRPRVKALGEFVIVVTGATELCENIPHTREAVLEKLGMTRNELYDLLFTKPGRE